MFDTNEEIQNYLDARGKSILNACPGSGKTTSVAYKLQRITAEDVSNNFSGVACLSFTNVAKDEINQKYKQFTGSFIKYPNLVSTIDSFINQYIVLPNYHLLYPEIIRPTILDNTSLLNDWTYFLLKYKIYGNRPLKFIYSPSIIQKTLSESYKCNGKSPNLNGTDLATFNKYCTELKSWQYKKGILTNEDASYLALKIINDFPNVGEALIKRFNYIILDEAQDTSEIHFELFDKLIELGLNNIDIIGDPYQSLYEWREARPDLFMERYNDKLNWKQYDYTFCRRSEQNIIDTYSVLRNDNSQISSTLTEVSHKIIILKYEIGNESKAVEKYIEISKEYEEIQIVVRGRKMLNDLLGYTVLKNYWKTDIPVQVITAKQELNNNEIKNAVNKIRKIVISILNSDLDYSEQKTIEKELKADFNFNSTIIEFLNNVPSFDYSLKDWTSRIEDYITSFFELDDKIDLQLKQRQGAEIYETSIKDLFNINENKNIHPVSTIHNVKGKTFDSLMLILSKNSSGQNISLSDYELPVDFPEESKRLIYVAMSRPRYQLVVAVPKEIENEELEQIFVSEIQIIDL